jgi:hypothetical protein
MHSEAFDTLEELGVPVYAFGIGLAAIASAA